MRVALFTECYRPIHNGVVASVDALRDGLRAHGVEAVTVAPNFPHLYGDPDDVVRIPSLPLPTATAYRLCVPYLGADERARLRDISLVHAHSAFVTGWMGAALARRRGVPLVFTYHTRLDAYAHYAPFDAAATQRALVALTRRYANAADVVVVPTRAIERALRAQGVVARLVVVPSAIDVARFAAGRRDAAVRARLGAHGTQPRHHRRVPDSPLQALRGNSGALPLALQKNQKRFRFRGHDPALSGSASWDRSGTYGSGLPSNAARGFSMRSALATSSPRELASSPNASFKRDGREVTL